MKTWITGTTPTTAAPPPVQQQQQVADLNQRNQQQQQQQSSKIPYQQQHVPNPVTAADYKQYYDSGWYQDEYGQWFQDPNYVPPQQQTQPSSYVVGSQQQQSSTRPAQQQQQQPIATSSSSYVVKDASTASGIFQQKGCSAGEENEWRLGARTGGRDEDCCG